MPFAYALCRADAEALEQMKAVLEDCALDLQLL